MKFSKDMSKRFRGSWRKAKKIAKNLVHRKAVVWKYGWQEEPGESFVISDSDWGEIVAIGDRHLGGRGTWDKT